jgi:hypothetical protein
MGVARFTADRRIVLLKTVTSKIYNPSAISGKMADRNRTTTVSEERNVKN